MRLITDFPPERPGPLALVIGNFDGLHRGHRALLESARRKASRTGLTPALLTFEPHPREFFGKPATPFRLTSRADKIRLLTAWKWPLTFMAPFDQAMAETSAQDFVERVLFEQLNAKALFIGDDFHFGAQRAGTPTLLRDICDRYGIDISIQSKLIDEKGIGFSSTFIRRALREGALADARRQLGRFWTISGTVERGERRGTALGFPTANVALGAYVRPTFGVYAVFGMRGDHMLPGVANLGLRPTFAGQQERLEVHFFDFAGDLYGETVSIAMVDFLRAERSFAGPAELRDQIARDCLAARAVLERQNGL
ncbi:MAG TPA: riboflavin biosynthesis protein RibF [Dongiaceae bacterium]|jgi:riboflavin kinase/FMN adenylyltransferase|nr:riboflavin biosynthesis protein RibF [Dongiaceae bacterium]